MPTVCLNASNPDMSFSIKRLNPWSTVLNASSVAPALFAMLSSSLAKALPLLAERINAACPASALPKKSVILDPVLSAEACNSFNASIVLPPALMNSLRGVGWALQPRAASWSWSFGHPSLVTTCRPITTALQANCWASSTSTAIRCGIDCSRTLRPYSSKACG